jgi:hypothetical protein
MAVPQEKRMESTSMRADTRFPEPARPPDGDAQQESIKCPRCGYSFITKVNGKSKLRTRVLVFAENGNTMGICPKCKTNLKVPVVLDSRKVDL